jgi:cyanophycin synthetase
MKGSAFRFGMRQNATRISFVYQPLQKHALQWLEQWMLDALEVDCKDYEPIFLKAQPKDQAFVVYLSRLLYVYNVLLQDIKVPVFERAAIEQIVLHPKKTGMYKASIWLPTVTGFPEGVFHHWLYIAHALIGNVAKSNQDSESLELTYQQFQSGQVKKWTQAIPGGKSTVPILQTAYKLGIPFTHISAGRYWLGWGCCSLVFDRSSNAQDSAIGAHVSHNKDQTIKLLSVAGIPVPNGRVFDSHSPLDVSLIRTLKMPLVVKPVDKDRGEGVITGIHSDTSLHEAFRSASTLSPRVLIEEQVPGTCHRILVAKESVIFVVKRNPRRIIGDGLLSIKELIDHQNASIRKKIPQKRLPEYTLDSAAIEHLAKSGLDPSTVPDKGEKITLRPVHSANWGGDPEVVTDQLHPENAELALKAARIFGLSFAGIDFISEDISVPWHQNGAVINEINYAPVTGRTHEYQRLGTQKYLKLAVPNFGRIPIELFLGNAMASLASLRWKQYLEQGKATYFVDQNTIWIDSQSSYVASGPQSISHRLATLRFDTRLQAIVVFCKRASALTEDGLPFEYVTSLHVDSKLLKNVEQSRACFEIEKYNASGRMVMHDQS